MDNPKLVLSVGVLFVLFVIVVGVGSLMAG